MEQSSEAGSVWMGVSFPPVGPLEISTSCDVCVIGGGIAGLMTAERLVAAGLSVVLLEQGELASGETSRTTSHVASALDDRVYRLEQMHGREGARRAVHSHTAAIEHIEALVNQLKIDCDWTRVDGYLVTDPAHADRRERLIDEELAACARAGLRAEFVPSLIHPWPSRLGPAIRFAGQAQMHPLKFLSAVASKVAGLGGKLHTQSRVVKIEPGATCIVHCENNRTVNCSHVVVATNTPINDVVAIHTKQAGYQTYVVALELPARALPPALLWDGFWDGQDSYHYVRLMRGDANAETDVLIVGGEDHKTGQGPGDRDVYTALESWARGFFPMCGPVARRWSGEVMEPADGVAFIGRNAGGPSNVYVVTGDSGNGITHGAISSLLLPDLIQGRQNEWATLYDPSRKVGFHALSEYVSENANTLAQYADWLRRGDVNDESEIVAGQGAVIARGLARLAVYKETDGSCVRLSAACPHLGGVVRWNPEEKTWDCPCHASRFDKHGRMIHGPANSDLKRLDGGTTAATP